MVVHIPHPLPPPPEEDCYSRDDVEVVLVGHLLFKQKTDGVLDVDQVVDVGHRVVHQQHNAKRKEISQRTLLTHLHTVCMCTVCTWCSCILNMCNPCRTQSYHVHGYKGEYQQLAHRQSDQDHQTYFTLIRGLCEMKTNAQACAHTHIHVHTHTHACVHAHMCMHTHMRGVRTHTHTHTQTHIKQKSPA